MAIGSDFDAVVRAARSSTTSRSIPRGVDAELRPALAAAPGARAAPAGEVPPGRRTARSWREPVRGRSRARAARRPRSATPRPARAASLRSRARSRRRSRPPPPGAARSSPRGAVVAVAGGCPGPPRAPSCGPRSGGRRRRRLPAGALAEGIDAAGAHVADVAAQAQVTEAAERLHPLVAVPGRFHAQRRARRQRLAARPDRRFSRSRSRLLPLSLRRSSRRCAPARGGTAAPSGKRPRAPPARARGRRGRRRGAAGHRAAANEVALRLRADAVGDDADPANTEVTRQARPPAPPSAVQAQPGSTTTSICSTPSAVARPRCSIPASMSTTTSWSARSMRCPSTSRSRTLSGQAQPRRPRSIVPITSTRMPSTSTPHCSGMSSTLRVHAQEPAPGVPAADALGDERLPLRERRDLRAAVAEAAREVAVRVRVHRHHLAPGVAQRAGERGRDRRLADATLAGHRELHARAPFTTGARRRAPRPRARRDRDRGARGLRAPSGRRAGPAGP